MPSLEEQIEVPGWVLDSSVSPTTKLQQGDLIKFESEDDNLRAAGIVVTADCDLEQKKHARLVTLVPVVTAQIILERCLIIEDCERKRASIEDFVFQKYSIDKRQERETKLSILRKNYQVKNDDLDELALVGADFVLENTDVMTVGSYKKLMQAIPISAKKVDAFASQIRDRGDIFVLPDTRKFGIAGGMAWIRHIWQVPLGDIAIRTSEIGGRSGERIGRLDSPYRYRLTQLMAQVFSDIGLPDSTYRIDQFVEDAYSDA